MFRIVSAVNAGEESVLHGQICDEDPQQSYQLQVNWGDGSTHGCHGQLAARAEETLAGSRQWHPARRIRPACPRLSGPLLEFRTGNPFAALLTCLVRRIEGAVKQGVGVHPRGQTVDFRLREHDVRVPAFKDLLHDSAAASAEVSGDCGRFTIVRSAAAPGPAPSRIGTRGAKAL